MAPPNEPDAVDLLRAFLAQGLMLDPYLAGLTGEHFEEDSQQQLASEAAQLAAQYWREPLIAQTLGDQPAPTRLGGAAAHEVLTSSAAALAHEQRGRIHVDRELAGEAILRLRRFVQDRGFAAVVQVYGLVTFAEDHAAVRHYGRVRELDFASGVLHRPWVGYSLDDELLAGLLQGTYRLEVWEGERWVRHTEAGERRYQAIRQQLEASGYLERRLQLIYVSQFNLLDDWDQNVRGLVPDALPMRRAFSTFCGLAPGMRVLEAGCGMASQTFEGGLWQALGPAGQLIGLDPAPGMLERARAKAKQHRAGNVRFVLGRAEEMPMFGDGEFDAAVGEAFLHFCDVPRALRELRRVTRPGGTVAVLAVCRWSLAMPWFQDWFAPIFDLARRHGISVRELLHEPGEVARRFAEAGFRDVRVENRPLEWTAVEPELTVRQLVEGVSFFQAEVELLPWAARQDLIEELISRGTEVCERTSLEERTISTPLEFVRGTVPPA